MQRNEIKAIAADLNPTGAIAALIVLAKQQRLINESNIEALAWTVDHAKYGPGAVILTFRHLAGDNAGALATRAVIITNQPESMPTQPVRFMEFDHEYELRSYAPIEVATIAMHAVYFFLNGDLPEMSDDD